MTMKANKQLTAVAIISCLFLAGIAAMEQPRGETFKNLQVLPKNISEDSLYKLMDMYCVSLNVDCKFCHAHDKKADTMIWHTDVKPEKEITRNMMRMTAGINETYFHFNDEVKAGEVQAVTCYTCHKGQAIPQKEPAAKK